MNGVTIAVLGALPALGEREWPDLAVGLGDTAVAFAGAPAAFEAKTPSANIEVGLRGDENYPPFSKKGSRCFVDAMTDVLSALTERARLDYRDERYFADGIHVTGNTVVDALVWFRAGPESDVTLRANTAAGSPPLITGRRLALVTSHRRENGDGGIASICSGLRRLTARGDVEIVLPASCQSERPRSGL